MKIQLYQFLPMGPPNLDNKKILVVDLEWNIETIMNFFP